LDQVTQTFYKRPFVVAHAIVILRNTNGRWKNQRQHWDLSLYWQWLQN